MRTLTGRYYADVPNRTVALLVDLVLLTVAVFVAATRMAITTLSPVPSPARPGGGWPGGG